MNYLVDITVGDKVSWRSYCGRGQPLKYVGQLSKGKAVWSDGTLHRNVLVGELDLGGLQEWHKTAPKEGPRLFKLENVREVKH